MEASGHATLIEFHLTLVVLVKISKARENFLSSALVVKWGNFDFELEVLKKVSLGCEIHFYDNAEYGRKTNFTEAAEKISGVTFQYASLDMTKLSTKQHQFKRFRNIVWGLKHENIFADLIKIDREKCEYKQYIPWLEDWAETGILARQMMLEVHNSG